MARNWLIALTLMVAVLAANGEPAMAQDTAAGLVPGNSVGGVIDRVYVVAPPNWSFILETQAGSFVDCGDDTRHGLTDAQGRGEVTLNCGVTITETLVIPAAARSARIVIHH